MAVGQPSLLNRIGQIAGTHKSQTVRGGGVPSKYLSSCRLVFHMLISISLRQIVTTVAPVPPRRMRQKKGPKRLKKRLAGYPNARPTPASKEDLDKEMDEYRAEAEALA